MKTPDQQMAQAGQKMDVEEKLKKNFSHIQNISSKKLKEKLESDRIAKSKQIHETQEVLLEKSNVILAGPTGTGKTYIAKTLAAALDVPIAIADATTLTAAGYVGDDADTVIRKLLEAANGDVKRAETGIVFIDEIDKIAVSSGTGNTKDIGGESVQQALLKIIEGTKVNIKNKKQPMTMAEANKPDTVVDTTNILFIGSGAFVGLEKTIGQRLKKKQIGFRQGGAVQASQKASQKQASPTKTAAPGAPAIKSSKIMDRYQKIVQEAQERDSLLEKMTSDDLQKFGLIPEFIGRMPIRTALKGLTEADLIKILVEPKNAIVPQFIALFKLDNVELVINDEALLEIARMALVQKTGARGLRSILENLLLDAMYWGFLK